MNSFKTTVANLSPVRLFSRLREWRTACREERIREWTKKENTRMEAERYAIDHETNAGTNVQNKRWKTASEEYNSAEYCWRNAYHDINPLTPDIRQTKRTYENNVFRCNLRYRECVEEEKKQTQHSKPKSATG
ncbi:MAG: hypothetical protein AABW86_05570 [Candidatus Micrarchaeota archaeon]